jgi:hypothetical protein
MRFTPVLALFALMLAVPAHAEGTGAYLVTKDGAIVKTSKGMCLRTTRWTDANADRGCKDAKQKLSTASRR